MKTKHLFLATALMASFAACTNEEIVSDVQQNVATDRPTVENVKLTFGENVDSRLVYNKGYKWESTDVIGALLMDNVTDSWHNEKAAWQQKYTLTHHIHTSYPFTYNTEDKTWGTPAKMLEGNYFFAFPFESYEGKRQVAHSLIAQEQVGVGAEVRAESYAKNQFFIGYDRIVAGTQAEEALNNVTMTPVLGAIQLQIVNTGTQDYHINKVVLKGEDLGSVLTFNPASEDYWINTEEQDANGNDIWEQKFRVSPYNYLGETVFNTANYLDLEEEKGYYTLNQAYNKKYDKEEALLNVVKTLKSDHDGFSQLYIKGTEEERLLEAEAGNTAYVLIMATPDDEVQKGKLKLDIYTDEGVVVGIDLTTINKEINELKGVSAVTSSKVKAIGPNVVNTIKVQIDDNSFNVPTTMPVYNNDDLLQFIKWNANEVGARTVYATLEKDVTLTSEMVETLALNKSLELVITGDATVTLAEDLDEDVLDLKNLTIAAVDASEAEAELEKDYAAPAVKVLGELVLTKKSDAVGEITVVEGAELSVNDKMVNNVTIVNDGTLTIGEKAYITSGLITNNATMVVEQDAYVKTHIYNNDTLENEGNLTKGVYNAKDATITLGDDAVLALASNNGLVVTVDGAKVTGKNNGGRIEFEEGASVSVSGGIVYREVEGAVKNEVRTSAYRSPVNTWVLVGDATFAENSDITNVEIDGNYDIEVAAKKLLYIGGTLTINGVTVTDGAIEAINVIVKEDAEWTNLGTVKVHAKDGIDNEGAVENKGTVRLPNTSTDYTPGDWEGNDAGKYDPLAGTYRQSTMNDAVAVWAKYWETWVGNAGTSGFDGNPYNYESFVKVLNRENNSYENWADLKAAIVSAYYQSSDESYDSALTEANQKMFSTTDCADYEPAEFKEAVRLVLTEYSYGYDKYGVWGLINVLNAQNELIYGDSKYTNYGTFVKNYGPVAYVFEDMEEVRNYIASVSMNDADYVDADVFEEDFNKAMAAWAIPANVIENAVKASEISNHFMLETDDIVAFAKLWAENVGTFNVNGNFDTTTSDQNNLTRMVEWFDNLYKLTADKKENWSNATIDTYNEIMTYKTFIKSLKGDEYTPAQISVASGKFESLELVGNFKK